jgi:hypothetical protein
MGSDSPVIILVLFPSLLYFPSLVRLTVYSHDGHDWGDTRGVNEDTSFGGKMMTSDESQVIILNLLENL